VKPYYLHHGGPGARHRPFPHCSIEEGQALMRALRGRLSGLAQPTYVLDIPGGDGKVPVGPHYVGDGEVERLARRAPHLSPGRDEGLKSWT
jgi:lysine 2,3-aminomutase